MNYLEESMDMSSAMIEDVDDLDLIPDDELEETYLERIVGLKGNLELVHIDFAVKH